MILRFGLTIDAGEEENLMDVFYCFNPQGFVKWNFVIAWKLCG